MTLAHLIWTASALPTDASALESAISALERAITALESSSGLWEGLLKWFTGLVVVGLVPEIIVVIWEHRDATREWARGIFVIPSRPSTCKYVLELVGSLAIFLGVAGELWAGAEIAYINGQLRSKGADLRSKSDQLLAQLRVNAEQLHKEAEGERLARVELEDSVAWRRLTDKQKTEIGAQLHPLTEGENASVWYIAGDPEGAMFAADITESLRRANLPTQPPNSITWKPRTPSSKDFDAPIEHVITGALVGSISDGHSRALADAITRELSARGFDARRFDTPASSDRGWPPTKLTIALYPRPQGPQGEAKLRAEARKRQQASTSNKR